MNEHSTDCTCQPCVIRRTSEIFEPLPDGTLNLPEPILLYNEMRRPVAIPAHKREKWDDCKHEKRYIDSKLRRVTCQQCEEILDTFEVLLQLCNYDYTLDYRVQEIRRFEEKEKAKREAIIAKHEAAGRKRCGNCNKLFKPIKGPNETYEHWGICDPCHERQKRMRIVK